MAKSRRPGTLKRRVFLVGGGAAAVAACAGSGGKDRAVSPVRAEAAYPALGRVFRIGAHDVHATDEGRGGRPVVLIHGANVNLRDWTHALSGRLARSRRTIAVDRPGFGYSTRDDGNWTPSRQAAQLRKAVAEMGVERPIVVGHSWGASVALAWSLDAPESVAGVVSVSGATMPWGVAADIAAALGIGRWATDLYMSRLARRAEDGAIEDFVARAFRPQIPPDGYLDYVGAPLSLRRASMDANAADLAALHPALAEQARRYKGMRAPVEIVHGARDWLLNVEQHAVGLANALPSGQARVTVAPGVGHMAHHARLDLVERAIERLDA